MQSKPPRPAYPLFTTPCYAAAMATENPPEPRGRTPRTRSVHPLLDLAVWQLIVALPYFSIESFVAGVPMADIAADMTSGTGLLFFLVLNPAIWATGYYQGLPTRDHPQGLWPSNWKRIRLTDAIIDWLRKEEPEETPGYHGEIWKD